MLTRRIGESLNIGDDITITVLGIKGNQVRIGIEAPPDVDVVREELFAHWDQTSGGLRMYRSGYAS